MKKIKIIFFLVIAFGIFFISVKAQTINTLQPYEKGLTDKKSPYLSAGYVSFSLWGSLNFGPAVEGYNVPNFNYVDNASGYALRTNSDLPLRITARLDQDMPPGANLKLVMTPPRGAYSTDRILNSTDQNVITGISKGDYNESVTYIFWYDAVTTPQQIARRIIFTIHDD